MKILYHHRIRSKDGQTVHLEELIAALRAQGHEVLLVGPATFAQAKFGDDARLLSRIRRIIPQFLYELLELGYNAPAYLRLRKACRAFRPDVIYERHNLYTLAGTWLKNRKNIPLLLEVNAPLAAERSAHGGLALKGIATSLERWVWRNADAILPVTHVLAEQLKSAGVHPERITVICNGIDRAVFTFDKGESESAKQKLFLTGKTVLGFTGFVRDWHGLDKIIDALASPPLNNLHLLIVGDGPAIADLQAQTRRLNLAERVTFAGLVDRSNIRQYVSAFDIALQPQCVSYCSPLKLFEYMALGKAIVAPDQPNIREILDSGTNALLFDAAGEVGMIDAIKRLAEDPQLRARLGEEASRTIDARAMTWSGNASRVVAIAKALRNPEAGYLRDGLPVVPESR
jgi:glycosyltransferase involved in cell wall biosynthesis